MKPPLQPWDLCVGVEADCDDSVVDLAEDTASLGEVWDSKLVVSDLDNMVVIFAASSIARFVVRVWIA